MDIRQHRHIQIGCIVVHSLNTLLADPIAELCLGWIKRRRSIPPAVVIPHDGNGQVRPGKCKL
jgi:hypothetical protein